MNEKISGRSRSVAALIEKSPSLPDTPRLYFGGLLRRAPREEPAECARRMPFPQIVEIRVDHGGDEERQEQAQNLPADDRDGHRGTRSGAGAAAEGNRN